MSAQYEKQMLGQGTDGRKYFDSGTANDNTNQFFAIRVLTDCQFSSLSDGSIDLVAGVLSGITLSAGTELLGVLNDITVSSGIIVAFKSDKVV